MEHAENGLAPFGVVSLVKEKRNWIIKIRPLNFNFVDEFFKKFVKTKFVRVVREKFRAGNFFFIKGIRLNISPKHHPITRAGNLSQFNQEIIKVF